MKRTAVRLDNGIAVFLALVFLVNLSQLAQLSALIGALHPQVFDSSNCTVT